MREKVIVIQTLCKGEELLDKLASNEMSASSPWFILAATYEFRNASELNGST